MLLCGQMPDITRFKKYGYCKTIKHGKVHQESFKFSNHWLEEDLSALGSIPRARLKFNSMVQIKKFRTEND